MPDYRTIQKCKIYNEMSSENQEKWFSFKSKKFLSHIDTFYYTIYPDSSCWSEDPRKDSLITVLSAASATASRSDELLCSVFEDIFSGLVCSAGMRFNMYSYHFSLKDAFDVFIADYTPNKDTPPIFVQLRSNGLWLRGVKNLFDLSLDCVSLILKSFGISIVNVVENRIDYAFHTNYIQDPLRFFPDSDLKDMQVSQFKRWHKEGDFFADDIRCDYFTLGRRKSNNVFFRVYNKTKEVIEMGYKQFFIPIWYDWGLISSFDRYVLENTFMYGNYNSKERARCKFYLVHGLDPSIRRRIEIMMSNPDTPFSEYKALADQLVPDINIVCNIEFQCKRKFFYNLHKSIPDLRCTDDYKDHLYSLLEQSKSITLYLSYDIIRFVQYKDKEVARSLRPMSDWWIRLRRAKFFELPDDDFAEYCFSYQNNLDLQRIKQNTIKAVARASSYYCTSDDDLNLNSFVEDFQDFCGGMNDNDIIRYYQIKNVAYRDIERKKMNLEPSELKKKDKEYSLNRYKSLFAYWFSGIYNKRLDEKRFYKILFAAFDAVPESRDLFLSIRDKYKNSFDDYNIFVNSLCDRCLKEVDSYAS